MNAYAAYKKCISNISRAKAINTIFFKVIFNFCPKIKNIYLNF